MPNAASVEELSEQIVDYFSISTFANIETKMCNKLLSKQKFGTTIVMNIMTVAKKGSTGTKLVDQNLMLLFMMHKKR